MELLSGKMRLDRAGGNPWLLACSSLYLINIIKTQILISQDQSAPAEYKERRVERVVVCVLSWYIGVRGECEI